MAAASATIRIAANNQIYCYNAYLSDVTNEFVKFESSKIATSASPDKLNVRGTLVDVCLTSDLATPTHLAIRLGGTPISVIDCTAQLASVVSRPNPGISLNGELTIQQIA